MSVAEEALSRALTALRAASAPRAPRPTDERFQVIFNEPFDDLDAWATTGTVTIDSGKARISGSNSRIERDVSLPATLPTLVTGEITFNTANSSVVVALRTSGSNNSGGIGMNSSIAGKAQINVTGLPGQVDFDDSNPVRFYFLWDPISGNYRAWIQDDGTSGARYMGEGVASNSSPAKLRVAVGSDASNDVSVDNLIVTPVYAVAIGDSRVAGHAGGSGYDPFPGYYAGDDDPAWAFPYHLGLQTGAYFINSGIGSTTSTKNATRFDSQALKFMPKVVILGSSNHSTTAISDFISAYESMVDAALAAGVVPVLMQQPPWNNGARDADRATFNTWAERHARAKGIPFVRCFDAMEDGTGELKSVFDAGDGVHFSKVGAKFLAELILDRL